MSDEAKVLVVSCPECGVEVRVNAGSDPPPPGPRDYGLLLTHAPSCLQVERTYTVTVLG